MKHSAFLKLTSILVFAVTHIAILAQAPGDPDLTFHTTDVGFGRGDPPYQGQVLATAIASDGKVFVAGTLQSWMGIAPGLVVRKLVARLDANGVVDPTFDTSNGPNASGGVAVVIPLSDGGCLIAGRFTSVSGITRGGVARLTNTGALNATFAPSGFGVTGYEVSSMILQPDGKVLVGGNFTMFNGVPCGNIARLNADGSLDATFITGTGFSGWVNDMALQSNGAILVATSSSTYSGSQLNGGGCYRLLANGQRDLTYQITGSGGAREVELTPAGGAMVLLYSGALIRVSDYGTVDPSFSAVAVSPWARRLRVDAQGRSYFITASPNRVVRVNISGGIDMSFSTGTNFQDDEFIWSLELQADAKIVLLSRWKRSALMLRSERPGVGSMR